MVFRIFLAMAAVIALAASAQARSVTLDGRTPTIRLCPAQCVSVSGHGFAADSAVEVLETRGGWARLSPLLDATKLRRSFGDRVPKKPAYWVKLSRTSGLSVGKKPDAKKTTPKPEKIASRQQRRVTVPSARPVTKLTGLGAAENSMIVNALADDRIDATGAVHAVMSVTETTRMVSFSEDAETPARREVPDDIEQPLTTDKMAAWIAANRGNMIESDKIEAAKAIAPIEVLKGQELEDGVVALKSPTGDRANFGVVPDVMTTKLLDKRLNILPGMNSKVPEETVIALRHYALALLDSGTCKGIAGGGAGDKSGTIYLVCTDDLTKTLEFPLNQTG